MTAQKIVISFWLLVISLFLTPFTAFAQTSSSTSKESKSFFEVSQTVPLPTTVSPTSPIYTDLLVHNMFHTFSCLAVGQSAIGQPCLTYQLTKNAQGAIQGVPVLSQVNLSGGTLGAVTGVIGALYQYPPVRTADYLASLGEGFGFVKEAQAQVGGSGAQVLSPIISLWQVSRNIAYLIMIIIFVVIGLMVMFRQRINPQTVITAQAAIPGLVIGLILITFSYFLAGLISDTAFIGTNLVGYYFSTAQGTGQQSLLKATQGQNILNIFSNFIGSIGPKDLSSGVNPVIDAIDQAGGWSARVVHAAIAFISYQIGSQLGPAVGAAVGAPVCAGVGAATGGTGLIPCFALANIIAQITTGAATVAVAIASPSTAVGIGLYILLIFILIYTMLRLLLRLVNNFLSIIFLTATAPFHFLVASLPGRQGLTTNWILNILANVLAFPAVMAVFYFIAFILGYNQPPFNTPSAQTISGAARFPLLGGLDLSFINLLLAFGALMATPAIPDIIARTIGRIGVAGQLIGQELSGAYGAGQRYAGQAGQAPGQVGRDLGQLGQIPSTRTPILDAQGHITGYTTTTGLGRRVFGGLPGGGTGGAPPPIKP